MEQPGKPQDESFNPWSIVNLVFHHLAEQGLHPILGSAGDPGVPAAQLLMALGITPAPEGNRQDLRGRPAAAGRHPRRYVRRELTLTPAAYPAHSPNWLPRAGHCLMFEHLSPGPAAP